MAWLIARPSVTAPIASATNLDQLAELLKSAEIKLDAAGDPANRRGQQARLTRQAPNSRGDTRRSAGPNTTRTIRITQ